ncbi:MAG: hypothetical protein COB02_06450 [Candidatus Cloacimonadota bacterium]|nr:MAG: hypothetical protein COB02_06450 [Candidatus Cloacimonadota bacterium]
MNLKIQEQKFLETVAYQICKRHFEVMAIFLLETHRPLSLVFSSMVIVMTPFLSLFLKADEVHNFARLMEDRENIDYLIQLIEKKDFNSLEENSKKSEVI